MRMEMQMRTSPSESEASLQRRARVIRYRIQRGEFIKLHGDDPVMAYYLDLEQGPIAHGNPTGAIPEAL